MDKNDNRVIKALVRGDLIIGFDLSRSLSFFEGVIIEADIFSIFS